MNLLEREPLLVKLSDLLRESRQGRGRLALVAGEAGIGKTALVSEFCAHRARRAQILWGSCDAVKPARPFGPLRDIAEAVGGSLRRALDADDRERTFEAFLELLRRPASAARVVVIDDLHWADEATLDLLRVTGRRLAGIPVLVIGTYRDDEVGSDHPLRLMLGDLPPGTVTELKVPPLSVAAVQALARGSGLDGVSVHAVTAGNAFLVEEVVAAGCGAGVPVTVRDAVGARIARLSLAARRVVRAASVIGQDCDPQLLLRVAGEDASALEEAIGRGALREEGSALTFRHDLTQAAVYDALSALERRALHRRILATLRDRADPTRLARHAVGADDAEAVLELAPAAGRMAAGLGAHREAAAHFAAALPYASRLDGRSRADLLEAYAHECRATDQTADALRAQEDALRCWRDLGDRLREGECLRDLSPILYLAGRGDEALAAAQSAVSMIETIPPPGHALALAQSTLAQRLMTAGHDDEAALAWGRRALELAERLGDEPVAINALITVGVTRVYLGDEAGWSDLESSLARARAAALTEEAIRALINLVELAAELRRHELADRYTDEALAYMRVHDFTLYERWLMERHAEMAVERGSWQAAEAEGRALLDHAGLAGPIRVRLFTMFGRLRARRGDPDPWSMFAAAQELSASDELQDSLPLRSARAEAAWLEGDDGRARTESGLRLPPPPSAPGSPERWRWAELAFWSWKAGGLDRLPEDAPEPYRLHQAGRHRDAAVAWRRLGCPYPEAVALADSSDTDDLRESLEICLRLGARPLGRLVAERLRARGISAPRGPHEATRRNPAGLTPREAEVLQLISAGLRNADIAARLVLSVKTVDHHVSAILRKLGVADRTAAVQEALRLGLKDGDRTPERWGTGSAPRRA